MERMDEGPRPRKIKAAIVEGQQERERPRFVWVDGVNRALAVREVDFLLPFVSSFRRKNTRTLRVGTDFLRL